MKLEILELSNEEDVRFLFETRKHPEVSKNLFGSPPDSFDIHKDWLKKNHIRTRIIFIIKESELNIGYCQMIFGELMEVELGWVIHPDHQGKGFGKKSVEMLVEHALIKFPNGKIFLYVKEDNAKAVQIYKQFGFAIDSWNDKIIKMVI